MSLPLKIADKTRNMEDLRAARSYNDIVVVLSRIRTAVSSIQTKLARRLSKVNDVSINMDTGEIDLDVSALKATHEELTSLESFLYEVKYARSISDIIASDAKLEKFNKLVSTLDSSLVRAQNLCFKYLNNVGMRIEPDELRKHGEDLQRLVSRLLPNASVSSFLLPDDGDNVSVSKYFVVQGVTTRGGYALSEFLIALHANNNYDNTFSYAVSFPVRPRDNSQQFAFSNKVRLSSAVEEKLTDLFNVRKVKSISTKSRRSLETFENIRTVSVQDGALRLNLESGVTGSDINSLLSKVLPIVHSAFGVKDPRLDILHRVHSESNGTKVISFLVSDRNFYDKRSLNDLKRTLGMNSKTYNDLLSTLGG